MTESEYGGMMMNPTIQPGKTIGEPNFPILAEFDCGHCAPMLTLPVGAAAELDADAQTLTLLS